MSYNDFQNQDHIPDEMPPVKPGMYLATVTNVLDNNFMGVLQVKLLYAGSGNSDYSGQHLSVKYMSPFYGTTGRKNIKDVNDYDNTQKSYGMWMVAPDIGTTVVVLFMQGSPRFGYWIGCVPEDSMNFMIPGLAATKYAIDPIGGERVPVAEYNAKINNTNNSIADATQVLKPQHPLADKLLEQGLIKDDIRGITTSSARRESPCMVFGISTPGPLDVTGPKALVGPDDDQATALVSRLGGSTFVMDDGDDKFLRETPAGEGPLKYASTENGETAGLGDIPHNELIRLRTRTGHQILLHNSEDLIYIGNARGTTWIEMTSNGKIDIYAKDSISVHTDSDLNFSAKRDVNLEAGRNVNIKAAGTAPTLAAGATAEKKSGRIQLESTANINLLSGADTKISSTGTSHINSKVDHVETTGGAIHMNSESKPAELVEALKLFQLPDELGTLSITSIMLRVPTHEPWPHHENLDPMSVTEEKTDVLAGADIPVPDSYNKYSTVTDTFEKLTPPNPTA
jgi:hypothetical protein